MNRDFSNYELPRRLGDYVDLPLQNTADEISDSRSDRPLIAESTVISRESLDLYRDAADRANETEGRESYIVRVLADQSVDGRPVSEDMIRVQLIGGYLTDKVIDTSSFFRSVKEIQAEQAESQ